MRRIIDKHRAGGTEAKNPSRSKKNMMKTFDDTNTADSTDSVMARTGQIVDLNKPWEEVLSYAKRQVYEKDAIIPHTDLRGMYYLASGSVSIAYISICGRERLTLRVGTGCLFNEARTLAGFEPGGRFICTSRTEVWRFPEHLLEDESFLATHPRQILNLLRSMSIKMLLHYNFLADMGTGSRLGHVCRFILNLARQSDNPQSAPCPMTQQEVSALLGVHRATLARILAILKSRGVIHSFTHRGVSINDLALLEELAKTR